MNAAAAGVVSITAGDGGPGDDILPGTTGADDIAGLGGDDQITGLAGDDILYGDARDEATAVAAGADTLDGGDDNDVLVGGAGADHLIGGAGDDVLVSGQISALTQPYYGGPYEPVFLPAQDGGDDVVDGGPGRDVAYLIYGTRTAGVSVDVSHPELVAPILSGGATAGSITGVEELHFVGGLGPDTVVGGAGGDVLDGGAGDDNLSGGAGADVITGGLGSNTLDGGSGLYDRLDYSGAAGGVTLDLHLTTPQVTGGAGTDTVSGFEDITGSAFGDHLTGDEGANVIESTGGSDVLAGAGGDDTLTYTSAGPGVLVSLDGGDENDDLNAYLLSSLETVTALGGQGDDSITVDASGEVGSGGETVREEGGDGNDRLVFYGAKVADAVTILGGDGDDTILEDRGTAVIDAGPGQDSVSISIIGGTADVTLGPGEDRISQSDLHFFTTSVPAITVEDFQAGDGGDRLDLTSFLRTLDPTGNPIVDGYYTVQQSGGDTLVNIDFKNGNFSGTLFTLKNVQASALTWHNLGFNPAGGVAIDALGAYLIGSSGDDRLFATHSGGYITGGLGADVMTGSSGATDAFLYNSTADSPKMTGQSDTIVGFDPGRDGIILPPDPEQSVTITRTGAGGTLVDFDIVGQQAAEIIVEGIVQGPDVVRSGGITLNASAVPETLIGSSTADALGGGDADDVVIGGGGADFLGGGAGADAFAYAAGDSTSAAPDYICDFQTGSDTIDLSALDPASVAIAYVGGYTVIGYPGAAGGAADQEIIVQGPAFATDLKLGSSFAGLTLSSDDQGRLLFGLSTNDHIVGGAGADVIVGGGGSDLVSGGGGADTFKYYAAADSTPLAYDVITDFQHGSDKIDLTGGVAGGVLNVTHDGAGHSLLYFAPVAGVATGEIVVIGDVEDGDVLVDAGTVVFDTGAFASPATVAFTPFDHPAHSHAADAPHLYLA